VADQRARFVDSPNVRRKATRRYALCFEGLDGLRDGVRLAAADYDGGAGTAELKRDGATDAAGRAGDDGNAS
jgi:hypothetical protein